MNIGEQITAHLASGHLVALTRRESGYRVVVLKCSQHTEDPRHFDNEQLARQHARHLCVAYRPTGTPITTTRSSNGL